MKFEGFFTRAKTKVLLLCLLGVGIFSGAARNAAAVIQIQFLAPAANAVVISGQEISVKVYVSNAAAGLKSVDIDMEGDVSDGKTYSPGATVNQDTIETFYLIPSGTPGKKLTITVDVTGWADEPATASIQVSLPAVVDTVPPTYTGTAGISTANRLDDKISVSLTWNQAHDNVTADSGIVYTAYCSETTTTLFSGTPIGTFTGVGAATVTDLSASKRYYFGVRAKDAAGNQETNTRSLLVDLPPNAVKHNWSLYE